MKIAKLCAVVVAGAISFAAAPAFAASPITNAFKANVEANIDFLGKSSKLGLDRSPSTAVRDYARDAAAQATRTAQSFEAVLPDDVAAVSQADAGALMTGRSVAIEGQKSVAGQAANGRAPLGQKDLDALAKLTGRKFDNAFWLKQVDALSQLRADYQAYADDGDDAAVAAMAQRELPNVERRLAVLSKI